MSRSPVRIMLDRAAVLGVSWLFVTCAWAAEPWKSKPYSEWNRDEVRSILTNSPWVKVSWVPAPWIKGVPTFLSTMPVHCRDRADFGQLMPTAPGPFHEPLTRTMVGFLVTWESATIRQARIRLSVLCDDIDAEEGADLLAQPPVEEGYVVTVNAPDMQPFEAMDEAALQRECFLLLKKSKQKLSPSRVVAPEGHRQLLGITFIFDRQHADGRPTIPADENEVEFHALSGKTAVKARFALAKMANQDGPDF